MKEELLKEMTVGQAKKRSKRMVEALKKQRDAANLVEHNELNMIEEIQSMTHLIYMDTYSMTSIKW